MGLRDEEDRDGDGEEVFITWQFISIAREQADTTPTTTRHPQPAAAPLGQFDNGGRERLSDEPPFTSSPQP
ncbi:hypothetical protein NL676_008199 [Syzygium grande]|nr:hypothetical protein NL676_008199 [Syzygium grande]